MALETHNMLSNAPYTCDSPTANLGSLKFESPDNTGDFLNKLTNQASSADTVWNLPITSVNDMTLMPAKYANVDPASNVIWEDVSVSFSSLASGGEVILHNANSVGQYRIREIFLNLNGTSFSGGGGDRNLVITDNTSNYSILPAATIQALTNARWGTTDVPYPSGLSIATATAAAANIVAKYEGGTTDYAAGSLLLTICVERLLVF